MIVLEIFCPGRPLAVAIFGLDAPTGTASAQPGNQGTLTVLIGPPGPVGDPGDLAAIFLSA